MQDLQEQKICVVLLSGEDVEKMLMKAVRERHGRTRGCELIRSPACDKMPQESNGMEERVFGL